MMKVEGLRGLPILTLTWNCNIVFSAKSTYGFFLFFLFLGSAVTYAFDPYNTITYQRACHTISCR